MRIDIITCVPELLESPLSHSIVGRAIKKGLVEIKVQNLREYGLGPRRNVDDYSYGGDAGMVLMVEPVFNLISDLRAERDYDEVIYMSPDGEIPAAIVADSIVRLIPGALTDETSALSDSFQDGLVSPPVYTRPAEFNGWKVPDVLLSGNPKLIRAWQDEQALERTKALRPELLKKF